MSEAKVDEWLARVGQEYDVPPGHLEYLRPMVSEGMEAPNEERRKQTLDRLEKQAKNSAYFVEAQIGKGGFGEVYRARSKRTGELVALKVIDLEENDDDIESVQREISALSQGQICPQLLRYYGCESHHTKVYIAMEYCDGGSCHDFCKDTPLREAHIAVIVREVLRGLHYLQRDKKIHRDVKSANILLCTNGAVKVGDFGAARQLTNTVTKANTLIGSPFWMAPEVMTSERYDYKADIWSLGITCIELATGKPPHYKLHPLRAITVIPTNPAPKLTGDGFSQEFRDFVDICLCKDPKRRPDFNILRRHPFVKNAGPNEILQELWQ